jgi:hypothetical protein
LIYWTKETGVRTMDAAGSCTVFEDGEYWMFYTRDGIRLGRSENGFSFTEHGPVHSGRSSGMPAANPAVYKMTDGRFRMIYEIEEDPGKRWENGVWIPLPADRRLYSAVSADLLHWIPEEGVRFEDASDLDPGALYTSDTEVVRLENGTLRMYYSTGLHSRTALSFDGGWTWSKEADILFEDMIVLDPEILKLPEGTYKMYFTTAAGPDAERRWIMSASSGNGVNFSLDHGDRIIPTTGFLRAQDPDTVRMRDGGYRMFLTEAKKLDRGYVIKSAASRL